MVTVLHAKHFRKMKKIFGGITVFIILIVIPSVYVWWSDRVTHLDAPLVKLEKTIVGRHALISGLGYPNAQLAIYANNQYVQDIQIDGDGKFQASVPMSIEGTIQLTAKQVYRDITSSESNPIAINVDLTPPSRDSLKLSSSIPSVSKEKSLDIQGKATPGDVVSMGDGPIKVSSSGDFNGSVSLSNGTNVYTLMVSDEAGNSTIVGTYKITVDNIAPEVTTTYCGVKPPTSANIEGLERVCLSTGQWEDWRDPAPIPIVGYITGDVGSITINGTRVYADENGEIYQRVFLPVPKGLNKYKVVVTDKYGNETKTSLTMTVQSVRQNDYDEVIDRLDDIESQL